MKIFLMVESSHCTDTPYGCYYVAMGFATALEALGIEVAILSRQHWYVVEPLSQDIVIAFRPDFDLSKLKGECKKVAWIRGLVNDWWRAQGSLNEYDLVMTSSPSVTAVLRNTLKVPVRTLMLAADKHKDVPEIRRPPLYDVSFVGNYFTGREDVEKLSFGSSIDFHIWGKGWNRAKHLKAAVWHGPALGWTKTVIYMRSKLVFEDHKTQARDAGLINLRVFEVLASGTCLISNKAPGLQSMFHGGIVFYDSDVDLQRQVKHYLEHDEEREAIAKRGQELVLADHTWDDRALQFDAYVKEVLT